MNQLGTQAYHGSIPRDVTGRVAEVGATGSVVVILDSNDQEVYFMTSEFKGRVRKGDGVVLGAIRRGATIEWHLVQGVP